MSNPDYDLHLRSRSPVHSRVRDETTKKWELYRDVRSDSSSVGKTGSHHNEQYTWHYIVGAIGVVLMVIYFMFKGPSNDVNALLREELENKIKQQFEEQFGIKYLQHENELKKMVLTTFEARKREYDTQMKSPNIFSQLAAQYKEEFEDTSTSLRQYLQQEVDLLNSKFDSYVETREFNHLTSKVADLSNEMKDPAKEQYLTSLEAKVNDLNIQWTTLQDQVRASKESKETKDSIINLKNEIEKKLSDETKRLNSILTGLENDIDECKLKLKDLGTINVSLTNLNESFTAERDASANAVLLEVASYKNELLETNTSLRQYLQQEVDLLNSKLDGYVETSKFNHLTSKVADLYNEMKDPVKEQYLTSLEATGKLNALKIEIEKQMLVESTRLDNNIEECKSTVKNFNSIDETLSNLSEIITVAIENNVKNILDLNTTIIQIKTNISRNSHDIISLYQLNKHLNHSVSELNSSDSTDKDLTWIEIKRAQSDIDSLFMKLQDQMISYDKNQALSSDATLSMNSSINHLANDFKALKKDLSHISNNNHGDREKETLREVSLVPHDENQDFRLKEVMADVIAIKQSLNDLVSAFKNNAESLRALSAEVGDLKLNPNAISVRGDNDTLSINSDLYHEIAKQYSDELDVTTKNLMELKEDVELLKQELYSKGDLSSLSTSVNDITAKIDSHTDDLIHIFSDLLNLKNETSINVTSLMQSLTDLSNKVETSDTALKALSIDISPLKSHPNDMEQRDLIESSLASFREELTTMKKVVNSQSDSSSTSSPSDSIEVLDELANMKIILEELKSNAVPSTDNSEIEQLKLDLNGELDYIKAANLKISQSFDSLNSDLNLANNTIQEMGNILMNQIPKINERLDKVEEGVISLQSANQGLHLDNANSFTVSNSDSVSISQNQLGDFSCANAVDIGTNYALIEEGASVVESEEYSSVTYNPVVESNVFQRLSSKLIASYQVDNGAGIYSDALTVSMALGDCWPMKGAVGSLTIKLRKPIRIGAFSLGHILAREAIDISSAPREFSVYGRYSLSDKPRLLFDDKHYDVSLNKRQQYYWYTDDVTLAGGHRCPLSEEVQFVTFNIKSNYGHSEFTCIYNIGVYGVGSI